MDKKKDPWADFDKQEKEKKIEEREKETEIEEKKKDLEGVKYLENKIKEHNLMKYIQTLSSISEISNIMQNRSKVISEIHSFYNKHKQNELVKKRISNLIIQFFSPYLEINPFKVEVQYFAMSYNSMRKSELNQLQRLKQDNTDLEEFFKKLESIDINAMIDKELKRISEKVNEINYDVPIENMFNFLLDFSQIIPGSTKTDDSTDNEYTLKTGWGAFHFKILEKEPNKKITYMYNFLSSFGEKGTFYIELIEPSLGKVLVKTRNNIQEISIKAREDLQITNFLGQYLKTYLDLVIGKIVAKVVQTTFYEKSFDDLTMGNYRVLQAKINAMGKKFEDLKSRFFEVKAPLMLTSFDCSECGATLNITSKDEKFIICDHCSTPFLMEWQKG
jgi:DNA-directed RNA polymerase subunit RPC12/RpoP